MAEKAHPAFKTTPRVCAICGKALRRLPNGKNETTYGFSNVLTRNGIRKPDGGRADKAHPSCVRKLGERHPQVAEPIRSIVNAFCR